MVAFCVGPLTGTSVASAGNLTSIPSVSTATTHTTASGGYLSGAGTVLADQFIKGNPIHFLRPRVMALIGIGLLGLGVFLRRREGNGI